MQCLKPLFLVLLAGCALFGVVLAQEEDEEEPFRPGLIAEYSDRSQHSFRRLDEAIVFHWGNAAPDRRISAENFDVRWHGRIFAQGAGEYRLAVHARGEVEVKLAGKVVISRQEAEGWVFSRPVILEFDRHELEVRFRKTKGPAHVSLYWSGPQFQLEPVPTRFLLHDRKEVVTISYERGELLAAALRCAACHRDEADARPMPAPSLLHLGGNISESWLREWLTSKGTEQVSLSRRMPAYGFLEDEAKAIAAYLQSSSGKMPAAELPAKTPALSPKPNSKSGTKPPDPPSAETGKRLFLTLGCLACHQVDGLRESGLFGGGDLSQVASKRPDSFFASWLAEPAKLNPDHRMPVFDLSQDERTSLSLYLASLRKAEKPVQEVKPGPEDVVQGRKLVSSHRCAQCHSLPKDPELPAPTATKPLDAKSDWAKSCAAGLSSSRAHLAYSLTKADQQALQDYFSAPPAEPTKKRPAANGRLALHQNNCLACHGREGAESLSASLPKKLADKLSVLAEKHPDLAASVPAMTPPSLNSIGDKYHAEALAAVIRRQGSPLRDYLLVRMPRFRLSDEELKSLVNHLVETDRIPPLPDVIATKPTSAEEAAFSLAGNRLVSTDGFGCTSCHQVGKVVPDKAPLNARGPSLSSLDKRIRKEWYDRFLKNPARIVPRMEMPSVQIPVRGVLDSKLDPQLAALWHVLATPGFEPPEPNPVRVLRLSGVPEQKENGVIITDQIKVGSETFVRPIVIGLPNRNNFLFDLQDNRLAAWWVGDVARQRTKGKSWHWEAGGNSLVRFPQEPELSIEWKGKVFGLRPGSEGYCELDRYSITPSRLDFEYAVSFDLLDRELAEAELSKRPTILQHWSNQTRSVSRTRAPASVFRAFSVRHFPEDSTILMRLVDKDFAKECRLEEDGRVLRLPEPKAGLMRVTTPASAKITGDGILHVPVGLQFKEVRIRSFAEFEIQYTTETAIDHYPAVIQPPVLAEASSLKIGSGLASQRLPLPSTIMPTALCWVPNGNLAFCTLNGQVLVLNERVEPTAPNAVRLLLDGLPAPYGIAAEAQADENGLYSLDIAAKHGVIGTIADLDPVINLSITSVKASGWGYTADYHDWTAGLIPAKEGGYYVGLPCQQDARSDAQALYRGSVARIFGRKGFDEADRRWRYHIEPISTGHRFPMGLAVNRDGDLFVTDNQGNYNPFNELNHVRKGAFFGFVNAIDKKNKDYKAPPTTEPAINIPHPWTRSVNGICFLYTPEKLKKETGKDAFGPLEGQLVGCEYDTRRLIRMSLQKIGETYQGCAYPLSQEPSSPEKGFLGPIVCAVSPRGELYVGSIRESGWGAGNNVGEIVKIKFEPEKLPCGIAEVKAVKGGFSIDFLQEVDAKKAVDIANYSISSYRRISTPAYGGPDVDRRTEKIDTVDLSPDKKRVTVKLPELRTGGFVYEIQLKNLAPGEAEFFPAEAYFTLHGVP